MKKIFLGLLLIIFALAVVEPASAAGSGKAPLYNAPSNFICPAGAQPGTVNPTYGFVVMNINHNGNLIIEVSLKGATPNATYDIWVNQDPGQCPLDVPTSPGALSTNRNGNGNAHLKIPAHLGAINYWVSAVGGGQVLRSTALNLLERTFTASDSLYYNGPDSSYPLYGTGAFSFSWDPVSGNVIGGYYNEIVPAYTGTIYNNVVTGGTVIGNTVHLIFYRSADNYSFTSDGTLSGNNYTGTLAGNYYFTATGN
jgi:hypothetical protein